MRKDQLAFLLARSEDGDVALSRKRLERPGHGARFGPRSAAARTAKRKSELGVCADAHTVGNTPRQGARVGDEQPAGADCRILVGIGFELVAEDSRRLVLDA
jgi:hypothetical protein